MLPSFLRTDVWLLIGNVYVWQEIFDLHNLLSFITWEEWEVNFRFTRFGLAGNLLGRVSLFVFVHKLLFIIYQNCKNHNSWSSSQSQLLQCHQRCQVTQAPTQISSTPVFHFLRVPNNMVASLNHYHTLSAVASTTVSSSVVSRCQSLQRHFLSSKDSNSSSVSVLKVLHHDWWLRIV